MKNIAHSLYSLEPDSMRAGREMGEELRAHFGASGPKAVVVYATMSHDHPELLEGLRSSLGKDALLLGCSAQGVVSNGELTEDGLAISAMGFGGDVRCAAAARHDIQESSQEKGRQLAQELKSQLGGEPKIVILNYDPLSGVDVEVLLEGIRLELDCPVVGGAASQPWGVPQQTFQFWGEEVFSKGAVALALAGDFSCEIGICHGTAPTGIASVATKVSGNQVLEFDGRRAVDVWRETTGCEAHEMMHQSHFATWAVGLEKSHGGSVERLIRGAFGFDEETGAMMLQAAIPEGASVMLHHRTIDNVLKGTEKMAEGLLERLGGRKPWAVLGYECGARTYPFLGDQNTRHEHQCLRAAISPEAPWCGMMAWGEIGPCAGQPAFHNYTYPLVVFTE